MKEYIFFIFILLTTSNVNAGEFIYYGIDYFNDATIGVETSRGDSNSAKDSLFQLRFGYQTDNNSIVEYAILQEYGDKLDVNDGFIKARLNVAVYRKWIWDISEYNQFYAGLGASFSYVELKTNFDDGDGPPEGRIGREKRITIIPSPVLTLGFQRQLNENISLNIQYLNIPNTEHQSSKHDFISSYTLDFEGIALGATILF